MLSSLIYFLESIVSMPATSFRASATSLSRISVAIKVLLLWSFVACNTLVQQALADTPEQLLQPFSSDGCSLFPDGTWQDNSLWKDCCFKHDYDYWKGGTEQEREDSDHALRQCVINLGETKIAQLMLTGVRTGGGPYWPTPYRWGYGWPLGRGYKALSAHEKAQVEKLSKNITALNHEALTNDVNSSVTTE